MVGRLGRSIDYETLKDHGVFDGTAEDLDESDVLVTEVIRFVRKDFDACIGQ
jgi:hypothetical protein